MTSRALATLIALQFGPSIITENSVIFITESLVTENYDMENPFKYGTTSRIDAKNLKRF